MSKRHRLFQSDILWSVLAVALVLLQFWWLPGTASYSSDSSSTAIDGRLGFFNILQELFPDVRRDVARVAPSQPATLLLLGPQRYPSNAEQEQLFEFVMNGGQLIFAPRWKDPEIDLPLLGISCKPRAEHSLLTGAPDGSLAPPAGVPATTSSAGGGPLTDEPPVSQGTPGTTMAPPPPPTRPMQDLSEDRGAEVFARGSAANPPMSFRATAKLPVSHLSKTGETLLRSESGMPEIVAHRLVYGLVVVCSSPDVFSNRAMLDPGLRRLAVRLVEYCRQAATEYGRPPGPIVFNEYFNASSAFQQAGILFSPMLRNGSLQLLLVAVLGIWLAFQRFGPAERVTTVQRRSLRESAEAVGNLQYRVRDGGTVVSRYLDFVSSQLRRRFGGAVRLDDPATIARRTGWKPAEVLAELETAKRLAGEPDVSPGRAAQSLRWLARLNGQLAGHVKRRPEN